MGMSYHCVTRTLLLILLLFTATVQGQGQGQNDSTNNPGQGQGQGNNATNNPGQGGGPQNGGGTVEFSHWMRWRFFAGDYPPEITQAGIDDLLLNSSAYFLQNLQEYQVDNIESLNNQTNIDSLTLSISNYSDCVFPGDESFWCHVDFVIESSGPLFGDIPPGQTPGGQRMFEDSVRPIQKIRDYINPFLWYVIGNEWYDVYEVQIGGDPDPNRNSDMESFTGSLTREEQETSEQPGEEATTDAGDGTTSEGDAGSESSAYVATTTPFCMFCTILLLFICSLLQ